MRPPVVGMAMGAAIFIVGGPASVAHEGATGLVKERMDGMEAMARSMKAIGERIKANRDLGAIKADARRIRELASHITHLFPPGSDQHPTHAKAAIWQNWADFEAKAHVAENESEKLAQTDTRDLKALALQVRTLSQACSDCHTPYRIKK